MIVTHDLVKTFKRRTLKKEKKYEEITAVDRLNLTINKGDIFGLIGPNGAGKTTTSKILSTLILPDGGKAIVNNFDVLEQPEKVRENIGLLSGEYTRSLYWRLSGFENLRFFARLRNMWNAEGRINQLIEMFHLQDQKNELVMKYSTGMKHKLALAVGLLHDPPVLILDEPLTGIDPVTAFEIKELVKTQFEDKTIVWASHNLYEIEQMCNKIALINNGKIAIQGSPDDLKKDYWDHTKIVVTCTNPDIFTSINNVEIDGKVAIIKTIDIQKTLGNITLLALRNNVTIFDIKTMKPTLEDIFMKGVKNV